MRAQLCWYQLESQARRPSCWSTSRPSRGRRVVVCDCVISACDAVQVCVWLCTLRSCQLAYSVVVNTSDTVFAPLRCPYLVRRNVDLIGTMITTTWQYSKPWLDIGRDQPTRSMKRSPSRSSRGGRSSRSRGAKPARPPFRRIQGLNHYHIGGGNALQYQLSNAIASLNCSEKGAKKEATSVVTGEENDTVSGRQVNGQSAHMHMRVIQFEVAVATRGTRPLPLLLPTNSSTRHNRETIQQEQAATYS